MNNPLKRHRCALLGMVVACCAGCGGPTKHAAEGTVTLDGQPLTEARILFIPEMPGLKKTGSIVKAGRYRLPADVGLVPGVYQVQVVDDPPDIDPDLPAGQRQPRRVFPESYATSTPLRLEIDERGQGNFDFKLQSTH